MVAVATLWWWRSIVLGTGRVSIRIEEHRAPNPTHSSLAGVGTAGVEELHILHCILDLGILTCLLGFI